MSLRAQAHPPHRVSALIQRSYHATNDIITRQRTSSSIREKHIIMATACSLLTRGLQAGAAGKHISQRKAPHGDGREQLWAEA